MENSSGERLGNHDHIGHKALPQNRQSGFDAGRRKNASQRFELRACLAELRPVGVAHKQHRDLCC